MNVSIIIVHYHVKKELLDCINSIYKSKPKTSFEIIVVDNDEEKNIEVDLKRIFPRVKYVKSKNNGFGAGNNLGAKYSKGDLLFFLNPDTLFIGNVLDKLVLFLANNQKVGCVAPYLLDKQKKGMVLQGTEKLTPLRAIFSMSFLSRLFPNNKIKRDYWLLGWDKKNAKKAVNIPGTAFLINKNLYKKVGGFDENFFLYFEEFDLCQRIANLGYENYILPDAKIVHLWERSTSKRSDKNEIFAKSRKYFFQKHYGKIVGSITDFLVGFGKAELALCIILGLSVFLNFHELAQRMSFIGDSAWFYLSARDLVASHIIPLVGITTSHTWLHQGPIWTYILAFLLWLFNFNPVSGAYFTSLIGVITVYLVYKIGKNYFSTNVGIIAAFLYATSPLVVFNARSPFLPSLIPFLSSLLLLAVLSWIKGNTRYFLLVFGITLLLYNFELATQGIWMLIILLLITGFLKKEKYVKGLVEVKNLIRLLIIFVVIMLPILIYDFLNGFPQTIKFLAWMPYKFLDFFFNFKSNQNDNSVLSVFPFLANSYNKFIFTYSSLMSVVVFIVTVIGLILGFFDKKIRWTKNPLFIICAFVAIPVLSVIVTKTPSDAYLPLIFPSLAIITAFSFAKLMNIKGIKYLVIAVVVTIGVVNSILFTINDKKINQDVPFEERINVMKNIISAAKGRKYNVIGAGPGSQFASYTMNYQYIGWILGNEPSKTPQKLKFIISEKNGEIIFRQE